MNCKSLVFVAMAGLGAVASAQVRSMPIVRGPVQGPILGSGTVHQMPVPRLYKGPIQRREPDFIQPIINLGHGHYMAVGPKVPYVVPDHEARRVGSEILDVFEGNSTNNANPDVPTDGLYGETFFTGVDVGDRWYFGDTFEGANTAKHYTQVFPNQAGKSATGLDLVFYDNVGATDSISEVLVFTSGDAFNAASPTPPVNFNTGVKLTFTTPVTAGSGVYSNVDLSTGPLAMPTAGNGWYQVVLASGDDVSGTPIECSAAQCFLWGTKPDNPSQIDQYEYVDGDGTIGSETGSLSTLFDMTQGFFSTPTSYTVTRGSETSTHSIGNLGGTAGQDVVVSQRKQVSSSLNQAEVTATVTLDPATPTTSLLLLRAIVTAKANCTPANSALANMNISMLNNTTGVFDPMKSFAPINVGADGSVIIADSVPSANIANYISGTGANRTVQIRVGARHGKPLSTAWTLTVNNMKVDVSQVGPDPLGPSVAFSTNL